MMDWTVTTDLRLEVGLTDRQVSSLFDAFEPDAGVSVAVGDDSVSVTLTVSGPRIAAAAAAVGRGLLVDALHDLGVRIVCDIAVEAMTTEEADRRQAEPSIPELVGAAEVGELLGVSRQRVHQLHRDNPRFPAPVVEVRMGPLWARGSVEAFAASWSRLPGRPRVLGSV